MFNSPRMTMKEMIGLAYRYYGIPRCQIQVIGHEVYKEYEYIDFFDLYEVSPRPRHRIRKYQGLWHKLY